MNSYVKTVFRRLMDPMSGGGILREDALAEAYAAWERRKERGDPLMTLSYGRNPL